MSTRDGGERGAAALPGAVADPATGPLHGLLVADFSRVLAGPAAAMAMGDLGADVIKVERPGTGDETRTWGPPYTTDGVATYYLCANRNKRSIALDLGEPADRALARTLATRADVLLENFTPGTMERFGLGYPELAELNPGLVYATLTGFGEGSSQPGYDFLIQAVGGLMSMTGPADGAPTKVGVAVVDLLAGKDLLTGVLAALLARQRTGRGQRISVSLLGSLLAALANQATGYLNAGVVPTPMGNRHPSIAPYETLPCRDRPIALAVGNDAQFARLLDVLGLPAQQRFASNAGRVRERVELAALLSDRLVTRLAEEWVAALSAAGVPCGLINTVPEGFALADRYGLDPIVTSATGVSTVACPVTLTRTPASYRYPPPRLDEHHTELVAWLTGPA